jgi:hypothetical protein
MFPYTFFILGAGWYAWNRWPQREVRILLIAASFLLVPDWLDLFPGRERRKGS